jgi:hypothetical protein
VSPRDYDRVPRLGGVHGCLNRLPGPTATF